MRTLYKTDGTQVPYAHPTAQEADPTGAIVAAGAAEGMDLLADAVRRAALSALRAAVGSNDLATAALLDPPGAVLISDPAGADKRLSVNEAATALYRKNFELGQDERMRTAVPGRHPVVRHTTTHVVHGDAVVIGAEDL